MARILSSRQVPNDLPGGGPAHAVLTGMAANAQSTRASGQRKSRPVKAFSGARSRVPLSFRQHLTNLPVIRNRLLCGRLPPFPHIFHRGFIVFSPAGRWSSRWFLFPAVKGRRRATNTGSALQSMSGPRSNLMSLPMA